MAVFEAGRWLRRRRFLLNVALMLTTAAASGQTAESFVPARWLSGPLPSTPPPNVVGWIEETLEVVLDADGRAAAITPLRASPLPRDPIPAAVGQWRFRAAVEQGRALPSRILVAAIIRPPQLDNAPTLGEPAVNHAVPSGDIPFPTATESPSYPPLATGDGVVLVEVLVGGDGQVQQLRVVMGAAGFDVAALDAAGRWAFRPARRDGRAVEAYAYLLFGFRQPVGPPRLSHGGLARGFQPRATGKPL